jgi:hypothetical protein
MSKIKSNQFLWIPIYFKHEKFEIMFTLKSILAPLILKYLK